MTPGCVGPGPGAEEEPGHSTIFLPLPEICFHFQSPGPHLATQEIAGRAWSKAPPAWLTQVLWGPGRGHCGQNTLLPAQGPRRGAAHRLGEAAARTGSHRAPAVATRPAPPRLTGPGDTKVPAGSRPTRCTPRTGDRQSSSPRNLPRTLCPCALPGQRANSGRRRWTYGGVGAPPRAFSSPVTPRWPLPVSSPAVGRGQPARGRP